VSQNKPYTHKSFYGRRKCQELYVSKRLSYSELRKELSFLMQMKRRVLHNHLRRTNFAVFIISCLWPVCLDESEAITQEALTAADLPSSHVRHTCTGLLLAESSRLKHILTGFKLNTAHVTWRYNKFRPKTEENQRIMTE
jgi:hypothetical protein